MDGSSLSELEQRKAELLQQQLQANSFLELDPTNADFVSLKLMIDDALKLNLQAILALSRAWGDGKKNDAINGGITGTGCGDVSNDEADEADDDELEEEAGVSGMYTSDGMFREGDNVLIEGKRLDGSSRLFAATIMEVIRNNNSSSSSSSSLTSSSSSQECKVKYFEYPESDPVLVSQDLLQPVPPGFFTLPEVDVGLSCVCKYSADGEYYEADVVSKSRRGVSVVYTKYGNREEVPVEYIRPINSSSGAGGGGGGGALAKKGLLHIPEKLKILPDDSEEVKKRKKNKLKSLKNHNKIVSKEIELDNQKASWQSFAKKKKIL